MAAQPRLHNIEGLRTQLRIERRQNQALYFEERISRRQLRHVLAIDKGGAEGKSSCPCPSYTRPYRTSYVFSSFLNYG